MASPWITTLCELVVNANGTGNPINPSLPIKPTEIRFGLLTNLSGSGWGGQDCASTGHAFLKCLASFYDCLTEPNPLASGSHSAIG
ncbi:MAG TPA: hypothetical protein VMH89_15805 [Candidatus Acidoferrum sp.]|nr:hypothetical protein [Candidatus Acidoferrum sp.]